MPICIECCYPVPELYHVLRSHKSAAPTPKPSSPNPANSQKLTSDTPKLGESKSKAGSGRDVRLTQCPRCKRFADKYVEHDYVVLFIDLVLVKPQVYRHLLFNRLCRDDDKLDPSILRLGTLLLLFDVYLTWSHIESLIESLPPSLTSKSPIPKLPILLQYVFYLFFCAITTSSQHFVIRSLARVWKVGGYPEEEDRGQDSPKTSSRNDASSSLAPPKKPTPNAISTALFVSSCMSLFPILMVVWKYDETPDTSIATPQSPSTRSKLSFTSSFLFGQGPGVDWVRRGVSWAVAVQNLEALRILLGCGYWRAGGLVATGGLVRWTVKNAILGAAGLEFAA
ncbi:hypothetical protein ACLMJK_005132 [Lecanora helva]